VRQSRASVEMPFASRMSHRCEALMQLSRKARALRFSQVHMSCWYSRLDSDHAVAFDRQERQNAGRISAGVNIDPV
jgi:hypothetical protein